MGPEQRVEFVKCSPSEYALRWRSGWTLYHEFSGSLPDNVEASCSLTSPDGDAHWSQGNLTTTANLRIAIGQLLFRASEANFSPPDVQEAYSAIPEGFVERAIRHVAALDGFADVEPEFLASAVNQARLLLQA